MTTVASGRCTSAPVPVFNAMGQVAAVMTVVGPTSMDYSSTISAVRAVARYVGRFLAEG